MKKILLSVTVLMCTLAAMKSEARSPKMAESAKLTKFDFQNSSILSEKRISQGNIAITHFDNGIRLILNPSFHCPKGMMCAQVMPRAIEFEAGNLEVTIGNCNERVYTAISDNRPTDGNYTRLTVVDNRSNTCRHFAPISMTEVELETISARGNHQEIHKFEAEALN